MMDEPTVTKIFNRLLAVGLLLIFMSPCASAEVLIDEHFSGSANDPDWLYDMIQGAGSVTFESAAPGYAHYLLDGPGSASAYHNAELYQHINRIPPYCDFEIRLRNSNNCGYDAPGWPPEPDPLYGMGSRGWGLWNFSTDPGTMPVNAIWFCCMSPESDAAFRSRGLWIVRNNTTVLHQELGIDLTQWHTYRVQWRADSIRVFVDDMETPVAEVTDPGQIPDVAMTYTTWIDNYRITGTGIHDMSYSWLPVPDFEQYIDVDYIRVSTMPSVSAGVVCQPSAGVLPFDTSMAVILNNDVVGQSRRVAARLDVTRADGVFLGDWRSGAANVSAGGRVISRWRQNFPAYPTLIGDNIFELFAEDVTPPPYNLPPYPPAGDTVTSSCTVTASDP